MLFIMGGEGLICAIAALFGVGDFKASFGHVPWHGLHFMDTVFPLFLFMAGVSFPFSLSKSRERGLVTGQIAWRCVRRGVTLIFLGLVYCGLLKLDFAHQRVYSVLGSIGFSWMVAALLYLAFGIRVRLAIALGLLTFSTLFFGLVPAPDAPADAVRFSAEWHFGCWIDRTFFGGHIYRPLFDPEGAAGVPTAIVTAMLGMFAGDIVRAGGVEASARKAVKLLVCALISAVLGFAVSWFYPINKALWSPSFTLVVGGYSFAIFALFYWIIDVKGVSRWTFFFRVIGMNSIAIYMLQAIVPMHQISGYFFGGFARLLPELWCAVIMQVAYIATCWLVLWFLYRKQTFFKV